MKKDLKTWGLTFLCLQFASAAHAVSPGSEATAPNGSGGSWVNIGTKNPLSVGIFKVKLLAGTNDDHAHLVDQRSAKCYVEQVARLKSWSTDPELNKLIQRIEAAQNKNERGGGERPRNIFVNWHLNAFSDTGNSEPTRWNPNGIFGYTGKEYPDSQLTDWLDFTITEGSVSYSSQGIAVTAGFDKALGQCRLTSLEDLKALLRPKAEKREAERAAREAYERSRASAQGEFEKSLEEISDH